MRNERNQRSYNDSLRTRYGRGTGTYSSERNNRDNYHDNSYYRNDSQRTSNEDRWDRSEFNDRDHDYDNRHSSQQNRYGINDQRNRWEDENTQRFNENSGRGYSNYNGDQRGGRSEERINPSRYSSSRNEYQGSSRSGYSDRDNNRDWNSHRDYEYGYPQNRGYNRERNYPSQEGYYTGRSYSGEYWDQD